jgi:23S rRNA (adenine2503-C2)-methyltransferase
MSSSLLQIPFDPLEFSHARASSKTTRHRTEISFIADDSTVTCRRFGVKSSKIALLHFFDFNHASLKAFCTDHGMQPFVAAQLLDWVHQKGVIDPGQMSNVSKVNREIIAREIAFYTGRIVRHQIATDATQKLLIDWSEATPSAWKGEGQGGGGGRFIDDAGRDNIDDYLEGLERTDRENRNGTPNPLPEGERDQALALPIMAGKDSGDPDRQTECVMIPSESRKTACVSSQVGCPVGCRFCASGIGGLDGNLSAGQIVEQVHRLGQLEGVKRITNIVFMGMGEPLANFANVTNAIRTINALWGLGISARKITISTVGLPAAIRKLVDFELPVTLALSLHAPNDEIRKQLIPWADYATIDELLDACDEYFHKTGREITLEYLLLRHVNDRPEHARELADLARSLRANVNLIRYNEVKGLPFDRPTSEDVRKFQAILKERHVNTHIRASRGRDIAAACGQLRHEHRGGVPVTRE